VGRYVLRLCLISRGVFPAAFEWRKFVSAVREKWRLTREGLDTFLFSLDPDREKAGRKYELLRAKLISYFDWRDSSFPEDHADEVLNRVTRKISTGEEIRDPSTYVFGIARMLSLEIARINERQRVTINLLSATQPIDTESEEAQRRIDALTRCLATLSNRSRELIIQYYQGDGPGKIRQRKELAVRFGLPLNALRIRACRVREKLKTCISRYMGP
jgi:DNA-directed RNA polymerase specialized sigma24 family protein